MARRLHAARPSVWWTWACVAILGAGAGQLLVSGATLLGYGLATAYPALLLAGALSYAERAVPGWLVPAAFGLGVVRGLALLGGLGWLADGAGLVTDAPLAFGAALVVWRTTSEGGSSLAERSLAPSLLALGLLEALTAAAVLWGGGMPSSLVGAWLAAGPALLAVQLAACGERDRRDLKRAQELLEVRVAEQTERYRIVSELSSDYSFSYRVVPEMHIHREWITGAWERITGRSPEELEGLGWVDIAHPADRAAVLEQVQAVLSGKRTTLEFRIVTKQGEERWLNVRFAVLDESEDGAVRIVGAGRDVTEAVVARQERRRMDLRMQETQRMEALGRLAGGIAHDFNNALQVVLGNAALALEEADRGEIGLQRLRRVHSAAEYAADLTDQILAYSGKAAIDLVPLDLSRLAGDMLELLRASVGADAVIETHLPGGLPAVDGDVTQLRQVLLNCVTNASEALGEEGGLIRVRTGARGLDEGDLARTSGASDAAPGHYVYLEVWDGGHGLEPGLRARVFEPFFSTKAEGRGLGLAAVQGIVRAHRGVVRLESDPLRGTTFQIFLPRSAREVAVPPIRREAPDSPAGGRVLVVDDDVGVLEVAEAFLTRAGFDVRTAVGGRAALELLDREDGGIDAVVLDLAMPDLSGEATYLALREHHPDLPVVLASGFDRERAARRFSARGIADFVRKPYEPDELARSVRGALQRRPVVSSG